MLSIVAKVSSELFWVDRRYNFIENYNEESGNGYFFEMDVQYLEKSHDLPFLPERMKTECVILIRNLKPALNHELVSKRVHRVLKFNQNAWLKTYIFLNTDLRKKVKTILIFFFNEKA